MNFVSATPENTAAIRTLLEISGLSTADLSPELLRNFLVGCDAGVPIAVGGLEWVDGDVLLRSIAVAVAARGNGCGRRLVAALEDRARQGGAGALYLLTTSADRYFARLGYRTVPRHTAPAGIRRTAQFSALCPASSTLMMKVPEAMP